VSARISCIAFSSVLARESASERRFNKSLLSILMDRRSDATSKSELLSLVLPLFLSERGVARLSGGTWAGRRRQTFTQRRCALATGARPQLAIFYAGCWFECPQISTSLLDSFSHSTYRRTRGVRLKAHGSAPFAGKCGLYIRSHFSCIPMLKVILTLIAVFLFTRRFQRYAILHVKPSAYGIPFFRTLSW
jgi:hypothetical protein